jgi:hypothetical protein
MTELMTMRGLAKLIAAMVTSFALFSPLEFGQLVSAVLR